MEDSDTYGASLGSARSGLPEPKASSKHGERLECFAGKPASSGPRGDAARRQLVVNAAGIGADDTGHQLDQGEFKASAASAIVTPLTTSLRLAITQENLLNSAAVESNQTKENMEALHRRLTDSHSAFEWLGPIGTANLILLLAHQARSPEEIEMMALPIVMLLAAFEPGSVEELVEKFDHLLRLTGEPANRAMSIADTLTAGTKASAATFNEMLDALIAFYEP